MDETGSHLLAGAAFPQNHHCGIGGRRTATFLHLVQHGRAACLSCIRLTQGLKPSRQLFYLVLKTGVGEGPLHHQQQILALEGLLQVVEGAIAHRQHRALHRAEGC